MDGTINKNNMTTILFIKDLKITALKSRKRIVTPHLVKVWRYDAWGARAWAVVTDDPYNNGRGQIIEEPVGISYSYSSMWDKDTIKEWKDEAAEELASVSLEEYEKKYSFSVKEYLMPDGQWYSYREICRNIARGRLMGATVVC